MPDKLKSITAERLREALSYDPLTGIWTRRITTSSNARAGAIAGCLTPIGYLVIRLDGRLYASHRLAWLWMTGVWPSSALDHKDLNKSNNKWDNLRESTMSQNLANTRRRSDNTSGVKGVTWFKERGKWMAKIQVQGKFHTIGYFDDLEIAAAAYAEAAKRYFGEFARAA